MQKKQLIGGISSLLIVGMAFSIWWYANTSSRPTGIVKKPDIENPPLRGEIWIGNERRIFTIFAHGTGGHRNVRNGELISELGAAYWGREQGDEPNKFYERHYQRTFLILDGVGTSEVQELTCDADDSDPETLPKHPTPGDFWPHSLNKALKPKKFRVSCHILAKTGFAEHRGSVMGDGWDDNVGHALLVLDRLQDADQFPEVINVIGWSRGAVTAIKLANAVQDYFIDGKPYQMQKDYLDGYDPDNLTVFYPPQDELLDESAVDMNLFLIDPVPGRFGGDGETFGSKRSVERFSPQEQDYRKFPPIVRQAIITLANDEQREGFVPLDAQDVELIDEQQTQAVWLPFPGIHSTQLYLDPHSDIDADADFKSAPRIVWDLARRFFEVNETRFERNPFPSALEDRGIVEHYANLWLSKEHYHDIRNRGLGQRAMGGLAPRMYTGYPFAGREYSGLDPIQRARLREDLFNAELGAYVEHPGFFINEHHRASFAVEYPALYEFLTGEGLSRIAPPDATAELNDIARSSHLWQQLSKLEIDARGEEFIASLDFRFGERLGEPLRDNKPPLASSFTGVLDEMGMID